MTKQWWYKLLYILWEIMPWRKDLKTFVWFEEKCGWRAKTGEPLKCYQCGCEDFVDKIEDRINHEVSEYSRNCKRCGSRVGYWAYGNWQL